MKVHDRHDDGRPSVVEFTTAEMIIVEIIDNLLEQGFSQGDALILIRGIAVPEGLHTPCPVLEEVLTPEFTDYICF